MEENYVVMVGNPSDGYKIYGSFSDFDDADEWIRHNDALFMCDTWIVPLLSSDLIDFPVPEKELTDFLKRFGNREFYSVCTGKISGEFCYAEYDYSDDDDIVFKLFWGVQDAGDKTTHEQTFWISIDDFKNSKTFQELYDKVRG